MDTETVRRIRKLSQQHAYTSIQMHENIGQKAGLSGTDHKYLGFLIQHGAMTAGDLANFTGLTTGAVTGLIDRFEKKKLVKRKLAATDRRKVIIEPNTTKIMALLEPLYANYRKATEKLIASFSEKDIQVIERYFNQSLDIMQATTLQLNNRKK